MLGGRATTPLHDTPLQFPNWEGVNEQPCSCMRKTLLCRTAQLNDARTPSFQVPGSHPLLPKPRLFHTNVASTLPRPAKTATTLCQGRPTYLPHTYPPASHVPIHQPRTQHARAVTTTSGVRCEQPELRDDGCLPLLYELRLRLSLTVRPPLVERRSPKRGVRRSRDSHSLSRNP